MLEGRKIEFGIPKKKVENIDEYEGRLVMIMHIVPETKGSTYKFELSKLAIEKLDLQKNNASEEKVVSFSFNDETISLANTTSLIGIIGKESQYNISMKGVFSSKNAFKYITTLYNLDTTKENIFDIILSDEDNDIPIAKLNLVKEAPISVATVELNSVESTMVNEDVNDNESTRDCDHTEHPICDKLDEESF